MTAQRWYLAVLVIASDVEGSPKSDVPALDLRYKLVRATGHEEAYQRALQFGEREAHSYLNRDGSTVMWRFVGLHGLCELDESELSDGGEVYSHVVRDRAEAYVVRKEPLTCFWYEANKDRTAADILDE